MGQVESSATNDEKSRPWSPEFREQIKTYLNRVVPESHVSETILQNPAMLNFLTECKIEYARNVKILNILDHQVGSLDAFEAAQYVQEFTLACYLHSQDEKVEIDESKNEDGFEVLKKVDYLEGFTPKVYYGLVCPPNKVWELHAWVRTTGTTIAEVTQEKILAYCGKKL